MWTDKTGVKHCEGISDFYELDFKTILHIALICCGGYIAFKDLKVHSHIQFSLIVLVSEIIPLKFIQKW